MIRAIDSSEGDRIYDVLYRIDFDKHIRPHQTRLFRDSLRNHERVPGGVIRFEYDGFDSDSVLPYLAQHRIELDHGQNINQTDRQQVRDALFQLWNDSGGRFSPIRITIKELRFREITKR